MESEKATERHLFNQIKKLKGKCIKLSADYEGGIPDRLCLLPTKVIFFVELKSEGEKPKPRQIFYHKLLRKLGFKVYVADTKNAVNQILKNYESNS